jgi:uncharacterized membrane protein YagU involved in acid resistance
MAAGAAGGLVAGWAMGRVHRMLGTQNGRSDEDATVRAACAISEKLFHHKLRAREKRIAGPVIHFAMAAGLGALYGGLSEVNPRLTRIAGMPFGAGIWLGADEVAVPALRLSKPPLQYPLKLHASALASHLVYGVVTDVVRRAVRKVA